MTSKLNKSKLGYCYSRVNDDNIYDDSSILNADNICDYCKSTLTCNYRDEKGIDNRRCFRYLTNGSRCDCILFCDIGDGARTVKRCLLFHGKTP